ncbi:MAG: TonB-dependent receptor plug domain-containing protein [Novosphingobium sp.]
MKKLRYLAAISLFPIVLSGPAWAGEAPVSPPPPAASADQTANQSPPLPGDEQQAQEDAARQAGEIVVVADRIKGQVDAPEKPIQTLGEEEIAAIGATSIADLLTAIAPQTGSGRGRGGGQPVMLLNGQRISSFREMRNIPPEAIKRVEILPEEVALRYGFAANQRVVNLILKTHFAAKTFELEYGAPDRGGSDTTQMQATLFSVNGQKRLNLHGERNHTSALTEAERGVLQAPSSVSAVSTDPNPASARTLIPESTDATLNATWSTGFGPKGLDGALTLNATVARADSHSLSGLNTVVLASGTGSAIRTFGDPLRRDNSTVTLQGGATLNKQFGNWRFTATLDTGHVTSDTRIDRRASPASLAALSAAATAGTLPLNGPLPAIAGTGSDRAYAVNDSASSLLTLVGRPFHLPAGDAAMTLRAGYAYTGISSDDTRSLLGHASLRRHDLSGGINLGLPITSARENVLGAIGTIALNFSAGIDHLSDFGSVVDWSVGLNWGVTEKLSLSASWLVNEQAPDLGSLGNPQAVSFNVPIYDFTRNETALVTVTSGGNPALLKERDRDLKLGLNWQIPGISNSNLIVEYFRNNSTNVTASFPVLTPDIEAAFPGRVTRDSSGRLIVLDRRPVTFANEKSSRLRWGFNLGGKLGKQNAMQKAMQSQMGRGGGGGGGPRGGGGPPMGGFGGPPGGGGRWSLSVYDTVQFNNRVQVAAGGPVLDLLNGDALTGGGVARHSIEMEGGAFYKGVGLRLNGNWSAPTRINGTGATGSTNLRFGSVTKINMRLFMDLGQQKWLAKNSPFLKNARVQLKVDNLFDSRQKVTDQNGVVPISYQPDILDPVGRFIGFELRKQF